MAANTMNRNRWVLWRRWVVANALAEMVGLGATLALGAFVIVRLEQQSGAAIVLLSFAVAVASGAIEATVVGLAQWWAMHPWFAAIGRRAWWLATLIGALAAYVLGYLPSTLMSLGEQSSQATMTEPPQWIVLLLAAGLGLVAGAVLSLAQWWVLRKAVARAGWWVPANMAAWMVGMPIVFWGIDAAQQAESLVQSAALFAAALGVMGALVGAIHGVALVWLAQYVKTP
ncbi:MAG: hypothetical protein R6W76_17995 [Caldilinea sp.]